MLSAILHEESLVSLRIAYSNWGYQIFTWRTQAKQEVDLILYGEKGLHAIGIKRSSRIRKEDLETLQLFKRDYPMANLHFIYGGHEHKILNAIMIWPLEKFLKEISQFGKATNLKN